MRAGSVTQYAPRLEVENPAWHTRAACAGGYAPIFQVDQLTYQRKAQAVCRSCPVQVACLNWALRMENGKRGSHRSQVYGGMTPHQRARFERLRLTLHQE